MTKIFVHSKTVGQISFVPVYSTKNRPCFSLTTNDGSPSYTGQDDSGEDDGGSETRTWSSIFFHLQKSRSVVREKHYADALLVNTSDVDDGNIEVEMEAALKEYDQVGADLGILSISSKSLAKDPSWLTRWIIGEEKVGKS